MTTKITVSEGNKQTRRGSLAAKVKHLDWVMSFIVRTQPCAICDSSLAVGYNPRYPGKSITLHHRIGSREVDDWENLEYVSNMVLCHKTCHRSYHLKKRHAEDGKAVNMEELAKMERNIAAAVERQQGLVSPRRGR